METGTADSGKGAGIGHVASGCQHKLLQVMLFDIIGEYAAILFQRRQGIGPSSLVRRGRRNPSRRRRMLLGNHGANPAEADFRGQMDGIENRVSGVGEDGFLQGVFQFTH